MFSKPDSLIATIYLCEILYEIIVFVFMHSLYFSSLSPAKLGFLISPTCLSFLLGILKQQRRYKKQRKPTSFLIVHFTICFFFLRFFCYAYYLLSLIFLLVELGFEDTNTRILQRVSGPHSH